MSLPFRIDISYDERLGLTPNLAPLRANFREIYSEACSKLYPERGIKLHTGSSALATTGGSVTTDH